MWFRNELSSLAEVSLYILYVVSCGNQLEFYLKCGLDDRRIVFRFLTGQKLTSFPKLPDQLWRTPRLIYDVSKCLFPQEQNGRGVNLTTHLYLSAWTPIMSIATTPLFHMLHGLHRETFTFTFTILFSETKICPIAFLQLRHSDIYLQLTVQKHRMCVSRCDNKENDVEFPVIMPLHPYTLQLRPQQLKFEVKGNFARYGRRPAKDTLCSPLSGDFTLPTFPSSLHQINLS